MIMQDVGIDGEKSLQVIMQDGGTDGVTSVYTTMQDVGIDGDNSLNMIMQDGGVDGETSLQIFRCEGCVDGLNFMWTIIISLNKHVNYDIEAFCINLLIIRYRPPMKKLYNHA